MKHTTESLAEMVAFHQQTAKTLNPSATDEQIAQYGVEVEAWLVDCEAFMDRNRRARRSEAARMKRSRAQRIAQEDGMAMVAVKWVAK